MAKINSKCSRRGRVRFNMSRELYESYQETLARARELRVVIDLKSDFERWFGNQMRQVSRKLDMLSGNAQHVSQSQDGFLKLRHIIGDRTADPPIPAMIPVSRSEWYRGVRDGRFPKPIKRGSRNAAWHIETIQKLISQLHVDHPFLFP